jgi:hypothetical protein
MPILANFSDLAPEIALQLAATEVEDLRIRFLITEDHPNKVKEIRV